MTSNFICRSHSYVALCVSVRDEMCLLQQPPFGDPDMSREGRGFETLHVAKLTRNEIATVLAYVPGTFPQM